MKKILVIATRRKEKIREIKELFQNLALKIISLADINFPQIEPEETENSYQGNAILKARFYGLKSGLSVLADDTGLEIDALPGKLGVKSKRYLKGSDKDRYQKLLQEMSKIPKGKRQARFITVLAFFNPNNDSLKTTKGICQGRIAFNAQGVNGFGYDPVFIVDKLNKRNSELTLTEKNQVSSRAKAANKMKQYLSQNEI